MTSLAPLTEAEAAAARALAGDFECSWHVGCDEECRADMARAVVAAVRPLIAAEALRSARKSITEHKERLRADRTRLGQRFEGRLLGLEEAAGKLTTAIKSLSLPASKETPDDH